MEREIPRSGKIRFFFWLIWFVPAVCSFLLLFLLIRRGTVCNGGRATLAYAGAAVFIIALTLFRVIRGNDREKLRSLWPDGIFAFLWTALLFIPASSIDKEVYSAMEKRNLAACPSPVNADGRMNTGWFKAVDAWFSDHFFGRKALMALNRYLTRHCYQKFSLYAHKDVYTGYSGWFFYSGDKALRNYHNLDLLSAEELSRVVDSLKKIQAICTRKNKKLYVLICPDKHKVYGEFFPGAPKIRPDSASFARQMEQSLRQNGIDVIYPLDALLEKKNEDLLYYRTDTHWTSLGAYTAYLELMKHIRKDYPDIPLCDIRTAEKIQRRKGDLSDLTLDMLDEDLTWYPFFHFDVKYTGPTEKMHQPGDDCRCKLTNPHEKYNLLLFRDSFSVAILPCLANTFHSVTAIWSNQLPPGMMADFQNADIVIFECVERYLPGLVGGIHRTRILLEGVGE